MQIFYEEIERLEALHAQLKKKFNRISTARLLAFLVALGFVAAALITKMSWLMWGAAVFAAVFVALIIWHAKVDDAMKRADALADVNRAYVKRWQGQWKEFADTGDEFLQPEHTYAADLDIFGNASLYQYLCCAKTWFGRRRLAGLLADLPEDAALIRARQQGVQELAKKLDFCRNFQGEAVFRGEIGADPAELLAYTQDAKRAFAWRGVPVLAVALPACFVVCLVLAATTGFMPPVVPLVLLGVLAVLTALGIRHTGVLHRLGGTKRMLEAYSGLVELMQEESFESPLLQQAKNTLLAGEGAATKGMRKLATIAAAVEFRSSGILHFIVNLLFLYDYQCIFAMERWKNQYGPHVENWLRAVADVEAYIGLAVPAQVWPQFVYPQFEAGMVYRATKLAHPLIPLETVVANDVDVSDAIWIVTGSNMSGKTTMLRTVGINLVLAYAGAPVAAQSFACSVMHVYTSMRNADDLGEGISTFYAELLRIKTIVQAAKEEVPMLFLLDELFKGTNSADRVAGAKAVVQGLNKPWSIGLISTHDFELCALEEADAERIHNVHFTEHYVGDEIQFDYKMRPGRCQTTNARHLMRLVGIDLRED